MDPDAQILGAFCLILAEAKSWAGGLLDLVIRFVSSGFGTLVAGAAGAFFGAMGAERIASRNRFRDEAVKELTAINKAFSLSVYICRLHLGLKQKAVGPLRRRYLVSRRASWKAMRQNQPVRPVFELHAISTAKTPIEELSRLIFRDISIRGEGLNTAVALATAIETYESNFDFRNELVEAFREDRENMTALEMMNRYYGFRADGVVDRDYYDSIKNIYTSTDDCIHYSKLLGENLLAYGEARRRKLSREKWLRRLPELDSVDWSEPEENGLFPANEKYG